MDSVYQLYLRDLGNLVKEAARKVKTDYGGPSEDERSDFNLGRLSAMHEIVSLMQQQAEAFGLSLAELEIEDIDPDRDLL